MIQGSIKRIVISRTDSIGDVILTLPMAGIIKSLFPICEILFLGREYTHDVVDCCKNVDRFVNYTEIEKLELNQQIEFFKDINADAIIHVFPRKEIVVLSKKAKIKIRIGTSHRWYNIIYCNKLVSFSRKKSNLHEAELNLKLLEPFGIKVEDYKLEDLHNYINFCPEKLSEEIQNKFLIQNKIKLIIHPKSKGSAREWSLNNYKKLIRLLPPEKYHIILTGTETEGQLFRNIWMDSSVENVMDSSGQLSLKELISLISKVDILLACSTGPLHIAGVCNIHALGLFPPIKPMHPARWRPLGNKTKVFCIDKTCSKCRKNSQCECLNEISAEEVASFIVSLENNKAH